MCALSKRENILRVYNGEMPEYVPIAEQSYAMVIPFAIFGGGGPGGSMPDGTPPPPPVAGDITYNLLKTPHIIVDPNIGPMPIPGDPQVKDITRWREYLDFDWPTVDDLDWSGDVEIAKNIDRENLAVQAMIGGVAFSGSPFNAMVDIMGHAGACIAMLDEEQKPYWHELINLQTELEVGIIKRLIEIYKPDIVCSCDDLGNAHAPFMSMDTYREMIKPYQERIIKAITEEGVIAELHCCGKSDAFVDDWFEMGIRAWNPAQVFNDVEEIKAKYGRSFVLNGGYDSSSKINTRGASEVEVRASIRSSFARYAPGGGYIFSTSGMALVHDLGEEHMGWIMDEAEKCSVAAYQ